jgi:hypothetical protein
VLRLGSAAACLLTGAVLTACSDGSPSAAGDATTRTSAAAASPARAKPSAPLADWPEFGLDARRSDATDRPTGITGRNVTRLQAKRVDLPGTVDSSPIYLHGVSIAGATHDVVVVTTTYGRTVAIDADSGALLWTFTPAGYSHVAGTAQITTTSPVADPGRRFVYAASPDGLVHKLALSDGREDSARSWPARITRDATHEKQAAALNVFGDFVIATTGGYIGDAPPYQGHVALIARATGKVGPVFNTLCANRRGVIVPSSCASSDSAILSRGGAVVEPGGKRILISTGNAPWNGTTDFGDSVIELSFPRLKLRQAFTPTNQAKLNSDDLDLGSSAPVVLGQNRVLVAGKDATMHVLDQTRLDGHAPGTAQRLGGEVQTLPTPGDAQLFTAPAVWRHRTGTTIFVADGSATAAYTLRGGRLHASWSNSTPGTSPIVAGGLLYVFDPSAGGIAVYAPRSGRLLAKLPGQPGHWNSPIVVDGHVVEPEGDANQHRDTGTLELFSLP